MTIFVAVLQWSLLLAYETTTTQPAPPLDNGFRRARLPQLRSSSRHKNVPQPLQGLLNPYPPGRTSTMCTQETLPTLRQAYAPTRPGYCYPPPRRNLQNFPPASLLHTRIVVGGPPLLIPSRIVSAQPPFPSHFFFLSQPRRQRSRAPGQRSRQGRAPSVAHVACAPPVGP